MTMSDVNNIIRGIWRRTLRDQAAEFYELFGLDSRKAAKVRAMSLDEFEAKWRDTPDEDLPFVLGPPANPRFPRA